MGELGVPKIVVVWPLPKGHIRAQEARPLAFRLSKTAAVCEAAQELSGS